MPLLSEPWVGVNVWGLAAAEDIYDCGGRRATHAETLESTFTNLKAAGVDVVRFWTFQSYAISDGGQRDWRALDSVFAEAETHGIYLIPVLGNNWTDCDYWPESLWPDGGQRKHETGWYRDGYQVPYDGYLTDYRQWVTDAVGRYRGHSTLVAWELINEPTEHPTVLTSFFSEVIALVRAQDSLTPISLGCLCRGEEGFAGPDYRAQHALPGVGLATVHDYVSDDPLPQQVDSAAMYAAELRMPFFVGEMGRDGPFNEAKIDMYRSKMRAAFDAGAVGYLLWTYKDDTPADAPGKYFGAQSPVLQLLSEF